MLKKTKIFLLDQLQNYRTFAHRSFFRNPPVGVLGPNLTKSPVVLIPGLMQKWNVFRKLLPMLTAVGHPVYIIKELKANTGPIPGQAKLVAAFLTRHNLTGVIIVAHSKGGLVAKYLLAYDDPQCRVNRLVALATPFRGTNSAKYYPGSSHKEVRPESAIFVQLQGGNYVNNKITSIYGQWDNAVVPIDSCKLPGAKNIEVATFGHHGMLFRSSVLDLILKEIEITD